MAQHYCSVLQGALALGAVLAAVGCSRPMRSAQLDPTPTPSRPGHAGIRFTVTPSVIQGGSAALVQVHDPGADSIVIASMNGLDRYSGRGGRLAVRLGSQFGDTASTVRYAVRERGHLFDIVKRPVKITSCHGRACREYYRELTIKLPERNERSVAVTGGVATVFTRRAITARDKSVLLREALNNRVWSLQAEVATDDLNARLGGYYSSDEQRVALDLSQTFKPPRDGLGYGIAMHVSARRADWLPDGAQSGRRGLNTYQASIGPSVILKGLTASSQLGLYTDGHETLQVLSTFVSLNGNLTEVRSPFSATLEKTFAFGSGPIVPRRREGTDRLTMGFQLTPSVALRLGMHSQRSAWPVEGPGGDLRASEVYYSVGAQYTLSW